MSVEGFEQDVTARKASPDRRNEQIAMLREALEPFAAWPVGEWEDDQDHVSCFFLSREFRKASETLAATAPEQDGGWRSMESAPRDGTEILAYGYYTYPFDESRTEHFSLIEYDDTCDPNYPWGSAEGWHRESHFSHWQPLPAPPTRTAEGE